MQENGGNTGQILRPNAMASRIELWPVDRLQPYANNARTHSPEQVAQIAASIAEFGFTNPILVDGDDGIVAGHGRLMAAQELGLPEVPVIVLDHLTPVQRRAYIIADNKLALNAGWDDELLASELEALRGEGFDLELTGFSDDELEDLLDGLHAEQAEPVEGEDEAPEPPKVPVTRPGDVWCIGPHRLLCGDSTDLAAVERLMTGKQADMLLTDPPYNVNYEGGTAEALTIANDNLDDKAFRQFLRDAFVSADAVMRPGAVFYIWHADSEGYNFRGACRDTGWRVRQCLIWQKDRMVLGRQDYHWQHEPCLYGWKDGAAHLWNTDRTQTTVLSFPRPSRNDIHPTMKPVQLMAYQLGNNTRRGQVVLDLFGGSGSTMVAAEKTGRKAYLMEIDPAYCDVIVSRMSELFGLQALLEGTGKSFDELAAERLPAAAEEAEGEAAAA